MSGSGDAYERGKERAIARNRQVRRGREAVKFDTEHPGLREAINKATFLPSWIAQSLYQWGRLTDKQLAVAKKILAERDERVKQWAAEDVERKAKASEWDEGRQEIEGKIRSAKWNDTRYGSSLKAIYVLDDGRLLWATVPTVVLNQLPEGDGAKEVRGKRIVMTVTVTPSDTDKTFAFGKRPSKARIL